MALILFNVIFFGGVLVQPFRVAEKEPGHHQVCLRADMAPDGHFAVAWVDSLVIDQFDSDHELFIRFFDKNGSPLTDPYCVDKLQDTNWVFWPCLKMDTTGNAVLVWLDNRTRNDQNLSNIRCQVFNPEGNPTGTVQTLKEQVWISGSSTIGMNLNDNGQFVMVWDEHSATADPHGIWAQRFSFDGVPLCEEFIVQEQYLPESTFFNFKVPQAALNDNGDLVVTWLAFDERLVVFTAPMFQVFDSENNPILPIMPGGHRADDGDSVHFASRVKAHWLDDDKFVLFWADKLWGRRYYDLLGRVFSDRGLTRNYLSDHLLPDDTLTATFGDSKGQYSIDVGQISEWEIADFAFAYPRIYTDPDDMFFNWDHQAGLLGTVDLASLVKRSSYHFQFTPPWGADTVVPRFPDFSSQAPAVAVCNDRIVWSYCRYNSDKELEAWVMISDWDMPDENMIEEEPLVNPSPIKLSSTLNRLSYEVPGEATLILYNSAGRRVTEQVITGKGVWIPADLSSGVYFARVESTQGSARAKVVVVR
ncbi:T9SS type A sorting domain-containing protein [candidate division WOR-3 bacterium]|nr:T9SS type A sorting domain-containing protein [candidate division WOR-3 bacterium]